MKNSERLNIVIPMAGRGQRFQDAGYTVPKPLIPIHGKPMIEWVIDNVRPNRPHRFVFIALDEHEKKYGVSKKLTALCPGAEVVLLNGVTEGAACTVLTARRYIDNDEPLMLANSDQWVDISIDDYLSAMDKPGVDGLIMTMFADDKKWSYVAMDERGLITRVVEKEVISRDATVGIYNYARGRDFVKAAEQMIRAERRVNNEFYVAPVYNEMIAAEARIIPYNIGPVSERFFGLGTPDDLKIFLAREAAPPPERKK